jgi:hypothetical protein
MSRNLSVGEALARLEAQLAFHRERETFHTQQEEQHRGQRATHAAEVERLSRQYEALKESAETVAALPGPAEAQGPRGKDGLTAASGRTLLSRLVSRVVEGKEIDAPFGADAVAKEIEARYADRLGGNPVNPRMVSVILRRMTTRGQLHPHSPGRPHHEAQYRKTKVG